MMFKLKSDDVQTKIRWRPIQKVQCPFNIFGPNTTGNSDFVVCHRHSAKTKKHSAKALPSVTLDKQHTASTVSANSYLPSVFYRTLGKWFAECQIWHSAKKSGLLSVFQNTLGKGLLSAEYFWKLHSANLFSKEFFFLSIPLLFTECFLELHSTNLFFKEKK